MNTQGVATHYMRIAGYGESDGSREQSADKAAQRRIAIVLEPLDHVEKAENKAPTGDSRDTKKAVEDTVAVNIPGQVKDEEVKVSAAAAMFTWMQTDSLKDYWHKAREPAAYARWIEGRSFTKKW